MSEAKLTNYMQVYKTYVLLTAIRDIMEVFLLRYCCGLEIVSRARCRLVGIPACTTPQILDPSHKPHVPRRSTN